MVPTLSVAHWTYLLGLAALIATVVARKNVVALAVVATFITGTAYAGSVVTGLGAVFHGAIVATRELLPIFIIIALVTAMLGAMRSVGADAMMVRPLRRLFRNGHLAYVVLAVVTYVLSMSFWPTPVLPLIAAILLPAAVHSGLAPLSAALAIAITGQGMALSADYVMGVAPGMSAEGANVPVGLVADRALLISLIVGVVALAIVYVRDVRSSLLAPEAAAAVRLPVTGTSTLTGGGGPGTANAEPVNPGDQRRTRIIAMAVPALFVVLLAVMLLGRFTTLIPNIDDGAGAPLVGGTAALALVAIALMANRGGWLEDIGTHFTDGIGFSFRTMAMVIPVAGFVYVGLSDFSGEILGLPQGSTGPGFLLDAIAHVQPYIPHAPVAVAFAMLVIGMVIGLDGNGWPGLPFTGSLADVLGHASGSDVATLAAIAQNGATWTGGGTLVIWSSLIVVAGITGVPVIDLARRLFLPVVAGLVIATAAMAVFL